jgi:hypothetical protein
VLWTVQCPPRAPVAHQGRHRRQPRPAPADHARRTASADLFGYSPEDFVSSVKDIITVGEFYATAAGGEIVFT